MEHSKCYIYNPSDDEPPRKRQKKADAASQPQLAERLALYRKIWAKQEKVIQDTLNDADDVTQTRIVDFIASCSTGNERSASVIPTGLVIAGPSIATHGPLFARLGARIQNETNCTCVVITSGESPNLKTLLKNLIKKITLRSDEDDDEDGLQLSAYGSKKGPKLLNFDLQNVQEWQAKARVDRIVVTIQDSEAFDNSVLVDLIDLLASWLDRLPFVLLFGIATSAEGFEERLTGRALSHLEGQKFDVTQSDDIVEKIFEATVVSSKLPLCIGHGLARRMLDRQRDHIQNVQDLVDGLKYAYMSHFYANVPSLLLDKSLSFQDIDPAVFEAVRNLPSFRKLIEQKLATRSVVGAVALLDSDERLHDEIIASISEGQDFVSRNSDAAVLLHRIRSQLQLSPQIRFSSIWCRANAGDLFDAPLLRETMLSIRKLSSDKFLLLLDSLKDFDEHASFRVLDEEREELEQLLKDSDTTAPLRSQEDVRNDSLRTTVVAQKVLLSKHKAALSKEDEAYNKIVMRFHDGLLDIFGQALPDPSHEFLSEIFLYDYKSPHTEVFQPKPRFAIERALSAPHDYLGCECCGHEPGREAALGATQPATALLYQLYLESGTLINASDLYTAFRALLGDGKEEEDPQIMALFQRSMAEMRYLGLVKPTRKKNDHIAKLMWKGL